jgi:hypothetical protein
MVVVYAVFTPSILMAKLIVAGHAGVLKRRSAHIVTAVFGRFLLYPEYASL